MSSKHGIWEGKAIQVEQMRKNEWKRADYALANWAEWMSEADDQPLGVSGKTPLGRFYEEGVIIRSGQLGSRIPEHVLKAEYLQIVDSVIGEMPLCVRNVVVNHYRGGGGAETRKTQYCEKRKISKATYGSYLNIGRMQTEMSLRMMNKIIQVRASS